MTGLRTALVVEARKAVSSSTLRATGLLLALGVPAIVAAILAAARGGGTPEARAQLLAKLGPEIAEADWNALVQASTQVTAAASVFAFGMGAAWIVGREFADGTAPALFGLPVSRSAIAAGKIVVYLCWAVLVSLVLVVALALAGTAIGLGAPDASVAMGLGRLVVLCVLSALIAIAATVASTLGRGVLPGVAVAAVTIVVAQISVFTGGSVWVPLVAPALWAMHPAAVPFGALALVVAFGALCAALTVVAWHRLQLAR
ncbi:ABC transporter permease [Cellulomonas sp. P5_C6]